MVEQGSYGVRVGEPIQGSLIPEGKLPTEEDLNRIFGVDLRALTEERYIQRGVLGKGRRLKFLNPPIRHTYQRRLSDGREITVVSQAIYFVDMVVDDHALMASFVPENSEATEHLHLFGIREHYDLIAGLAHLRTRN